MYISAYVCIQIRHGKVSKTILHACAYVYVAIMCVYIYIYTHVSMYVYIWQYELKINWPPHCRRVYSATQPRPRGNKWMGSSPQRGNHRPAPDV